MHTTATNTASRTGESDSDTQRDSAVDSRSGRSLKTSSSGPRLLSSRDLSSMVVVELMMGMCQ